MVHAVGIADQSVGHTAQVEQLVPVGVVAGQTRDLQAEDEADVTESDLCGHASETAAPLGRPRPTIPGSSSITVT